MSLKVQSLQLQITWKRVIEFISIRIRCLTVCKIYSGVSAMTIGLQFDWLRRGHLTQQLILMALCQELYLMDIEYHITKLCGCLTEIDTFSPAFMPFPISEPFYLLMLFAELLRKLLDDLAVSFTKNRPFDIYVQLYILLTFEAFFVLVLFDVNPFFELLRKFY